MGVGVAVLKAGALTKVLEHRVEAIVVLGLGLAFALLRTRPVGIALTQAPLLAFALAPRSTVLGIAFGLGGFVMPLALFTAIDTVLQNQAQPRSKRLAVEPPPLWTNLSHLDLLGVTL